MARRHGVGTRLGGKECGCVLSPLGSLVASFTTSCLRASMPSCLSCISPLRKTGGVMRFCDHGGAADFYKRGNCRGIWVEIVLEFSSGAVGFLVSGAQRAVYRNRMGEWEKGRMGDRRLGAGGTRFD